MRVPSSCVPRCGPLSTSTYKMCLRIFAPARGWALMQRLAALWHNEVGRGWPFPSSRAGGGRGAGRGAVAWVRLVAALCRALARRGWVGLTCAQQDGGRGYGLLQRCVPAEELLCRGGPVSAHWIAGRPRGRLVLRYGTEAQRAFSL